MQSSEIRLDAIFEQIRAQACVAERFLDKERYQVIVATLWSNLVMNPEDAGLQDCDLETVHDTINAEISTDLGDNASLNSCFKFLTTKQGERAMLETKISSTHRDLLLYFSSMILDPEGHKRWTKDLRERQKD